LLAAVTAAVTASETRITAAITAAITASETRLNAAVTAAVTASETRITAAITASETRLRGDLQALEKQQQNFNAKVHVDRMSLVIDTQSLMPIAYEYNKTIIWTG
jgi:predicted component of type VI protein secretion system